MTQYVITVIAKSAISRDDAEAVQKVVLSFTNSADIRALSENKAYDIFFEIDNDESTKSTILEQAQSPKYDLVWQARNHRKDKELFVFDMDSTLIYQEVIELIAAYANIEDKVAEITERAMNGEIDFTESLQQRVKLLAGIDATTIWEELKHKIQITKGARTLCAVLKKLGVVMAVCSGGFIPLAEHIKSELGLDYAYANQLGTTSEGILDGTTQGPVVDGNRKAFLLEQIASSHNINPKNAVAVGDGANDLKMMSRAGWGVAWNAKPKVQKEAPCCLNSDSLADILYIMGYSDKEIKAMQ